MELAKPRGCCMIALCQSRWWRTADMLKHMLHPVQGAHHVGVLPATAALRRNFSKWHQRLKMCESAEAWLQPHACATQGRTGLHIAGAVCHTAAGWEQARVVALLHHDCGARAQAPESAHEGQGRYAVRAGHTCTFVEVCRIDSQKWITSNSCHNGSGPCMIRHTASPSLYSHAPRILPFAGCAHNRVFARWRSA